MECNLAKMKKTSAKHFSRSTNESLLKAHWSTFK